ncbi:cupredoxin domain-containing protein [Nocardioides speluncae]|uniref:cupredoxin domain-containing protein n=1 Tax=Nocardioides speluncae TaxID=2670337 RepID=UPI000D686802|nr:hypothetical protein [Nocardioides speluncae]
MNRVRKATALAVAAALLLVGAGCGGDDGNGGDDPDRKPGDPIQITFLGDTVKPSGERVEAKVNEEVELVVTADAPGQLHVHSNPEQTFEYDEGTETFTVTFDKPGIYDVESHELEQIIVQLEVR